MDTKEIEEIKADVIKKDMEFEAQIGRSYAPEFVRNLADVAGNTLREWLKKNGCPEQAIDLLDNVIILERDTIHLENHNLSDWDARGLAQEIGNITERIAQLGGVFHDEYCVSRTRENMITWQPALQINQE